MFQPTPARHYNNLWKNICPRSQQDYIESVTFFFCGGETDAQYKEQSQVIIRKWHIFAHLSLTKLKPLMNIDAD